MILAFCPFTCCFYCQHLPCHKSPLAEITVIDIFLAVSFLVFFVCLFCLWEYVIWVDWCSCCTRCFSSCVIPSLTLKVSVMHHTRSLVCVTSLLPSFDQILHRSLDVFLLISVRFLLFVKLDVSVHLSSFGFKISTFVCLLAYCYVLLKTFCWVLIP